MLLMHGWRGMRKHLVRAMLNSCAWLQLRTPGRGLLQHRMRLRQPCGTYGRRR